jgi:hypothetical protein
MIDLTILLGAFLTGAAAGFLVLLRVGSAQEGRWLSAEPPTRVAAAARRLTSLRVQVPGEAIGAQKAADER